MTANAKADSAVIGSTRGLAAEDVARLVARAQGGSTEAFDALTRRYLRPAYLVALAVLGRMADAEDVAQDAMLAAFEKLRTCREPARFGAWVLQIARNRALNRVEARRLRDVTSNGRTPEGVALPRNETCARLREDLLAALALLREREREVVLLHDLEEWTHAEIGDSLGISELMSRQHLFGARRKLRELLASYGPFAPAG